MSLWTNTKRIARYGFIGFIRNGFVSLAAVLIMIITLFTILWVVIAGAGFQSALQWLSDQVDITVYFTPTATADQISQIQTQLSALPEVASTTLRSPDGVLALYKARHQDEQLQMQALDELGQNPFGPELEVRAKETSQYAGLAKRLTDIQQSGSAGSSGIDKVSYQQNEKSIEALNGFIHAFRTIGLVIGAVLAGTALLIIFNTIQLVIYTSREEIGIMNIVGAGRWFVRGPFIVAGVLYGLIGGIIVLIVSYPLALWLGAPSEQFFMGFFNVFTYFTSHFPLLLLIVLGSGVVLGALSSFFAVRRYLKM